MSKIKNVYMGVKQVIALMEKGKDYEYSVAQTLRSDPTLTSFDEQVIRRYVIEEMKEHKK